MVQTKQDFIKSFLPDQVENIELTQINLDATDLGLADILRNLNEIYPANSRTRNAIESGSTVIGVLCKTETLNPMQGLFVLVGADHLEFELVSTNYIIICISEKTLRKQESILDAIDNLTSYLIKNYKDTIPNLADFYRKFIYDMSEDEDDSDDTDYYDD